MPGLLSKLLPRDPSFFEMFNRQAENVYQASQAMVELLEHYDDPVASADRVERFEHAGDTMTHDIITRLNQTFITPFDREDIHELSTKIDDVLDLLDSAATRLVTYHVTTIRPGVAGSGAGGDEGSQRDFGGDSGARATGSHSGSLH